MQVTHFLIIIPYILSVSESDMQPYIVGGKEARIGDFPYLAHLGVQCTDATKEYLLSWICGSSIINQNVLLTAGHCVAGCSNDALMTISVGHTYVVENGITTVHSFLLHESYDDEFLGNDIALIRTNAPLEFTKNVSRIAIIKCPPYNEPAKVAGWGIINEKTNEYPLTLKYVEQLVLDTRECLNLMGWIQEGTICASNADKNIVIAQGDSGGALVVRGFIQIGIVSAKNPSENSNIALYTDVGYFYDWINESSEIIMCFDQESSDDE